MNALVFVLTCLVSGALFGALTGWLSTLGTAPCRFLAAYPWRVAGRGCLLAAAAVAGLSPQMGDELPRGMWHAWGAAMFGIETPALCFGLALIVLGSTRGLAMTWRRSRPKAATIVFIWLALTVYPAFRQVTGRAMLPTSDTHALPLMPLLVAWPLAAGVALKIGDRGRQRHPRAGASRDADSRPEKAITFGFLELVAARVPQKLPGRTRPWLVEWWPWMTSAALLIMLPPLPLALGLLSLGASFGGTADASKVGCLEVALGVQLALTVISLPGLFAKTTWGWTSAVFARIGGLIVGLVGATLVDRLVGEAAVAVYLLFHLAELWVLFQLREFYGRRPLAEPIA